MNYLVTFFADPHPNTMTTTKTARRVFKGEVVGATVRERGYGPRAEITVRCGQEVVWFGTTGADFYAETGWGRYGCNPHAKLDRGDVVEFEAAVKTTRDGRDAGTTFVVVTRPKLVKLERGEVGRARDDEAAEAKASAERKAADNALAGAFVAMAAAIQASEWRAALAGLTTARDAVATAYGHGGPNDYSAWRTVETFEVERIVEAAIEEACRARKSGATKRLDIPAAGRRGGWYGTDSLVAGDGWAITTTYWVASDYDGYSTRCWVSVDEAAAIVAAARVQAAETLLRRRYGMAA
jgi:hypothetical protein